MFPTLLDTLAYAARATITEERKSVLRPLAEYIKAKAAANEPIRLNFICTHNSRRSHLSQVWAQTMAFHLGVRNVFCYSGGTEATAMFPKVVETLAQQGLEIKCIAETENPVYAVKYDSIEPPVVCFSKVYYHRFNPARDFAAIMTCDNADEGCPLVNGAEARFPVKYDDPKAFDGTPLQAEKYAERSLQIASEMFWLFGFVKGSSIQP